MKAPMPMPAISLVRDLYSYNQETGAFVRTKDVAWNARLNDVAGVIDRHGYVKLSIAGRQYPAHRIAWLVVHGFVPDLLIDHVNGVRSDNRIANLRLASASQNLQNQVRAQKGSSTGLLGVYFDPRSGRYNAKIAAERKTHWLGTFGTAQEASAAYLDAKARLHKFNAAGGVH